jgi:hypothetical protein
MEKLFQFWNGKQLLFQYHYMEYYISSKCWNPANEVLGRRVHSAIFIPKTIRHSDFFQSFSQSFFLSFSQVLPKLRLKVGIMLTALAQTALHGGDKMI